MRSGRVLATVLALASLSGAVSAQGRGGRATSIQPGEQCPPGTTEIRPRSCMAPEVPPPSIVDYRPRSMLVVPAHVVKKAKFPAIDFHGHPGQLVGTPEGLAQLGALLDSLNVRGMIAADHISGDRLKTVMAAIRESPMRDRIRVFTGFDLRNVGPGWAAKVVAQLEADAAAGAIGVGEIQQSFGLSIKKADGSRLKLDDPDLDPVWEACARLKLPVFLHTADPPAFFKPFDYNNERWLEMALFGDRRYPADRFPTFETLMAERDNLLRRHPRTTFVVAHMSWYANDLGRLDKLMSELPNVYTEVGAVLYDIGRQPRVAREFFLKFQDRIMFGKDSFQPEEYPYYWRVFETDDDYFDYYRNYHAFWKLYGIALPDSVLKKVYFANVLKLFPSFPQAGYPR